uniref:Secreted protein n=1 Tax=Phaeomonas parva TaxID=124430 RepID=A0A7S1XQD4_9STRA
MSSAALLGSTALFLGTVVVAQLGQVLRVVGDLDLERAAITGRDVLAVVELLQEDLEEVAAGALVGVHLLHGLELHVRQGHHLIHARHGCGCRGLLGAGRLSSLGLGSGPAEPSHA